MKRQLTGIISYGDAALRASTHDLLEVLQKLVKVQEAQLGLQVGVFAQVSPRVALLCTEALLDTEDVTQAGETRLEVELRALRQEGGLAVVVELEERSTTLDLRLHHARRRHLQKAESSVLFAERAENGCPHLEDSRGRLATDDEVALVGEERRLSVLVDLVGDGLVPSGGLAHDPPPVSDELVSVGGGLALGQLLEGSVDLDSRLVGERHGVVVLSLQAEEGLIPEMVNVSNRPDGPLYLRIIKPRKGDSPACQKAQSARIPFRPSAP